MIILPAVVVGGLVALGIVFFAGYCLTHWILELIIKIRKMEQDPRWDNSLVDFVAIIGGVIAIVLGILLLYNTRNSSALGVWIGLILLGYVASVASFGIWGMNTGRPAKSSARSEEYTYTPPQPRYRTHRNSQDTQASVVMQPEPRIIILCEKCCHKLRIPRRSRKMIITCPVCRHEFPFHYYFWGFSSSSKKPLLVGLLGGLAGFAMVEILELFPALSAGNIYLSALLKLGAFGVCYGAITGASEGYFRKDPGRLKYGLKIGMLLGVVSGVISGLVGQAVFTAILSSNPADQIPSASTAILARVVGWGVLGALIGASYGIKENTLGDVKFGLAGGAIGGLIGGLVFDPLGMLISIGSGTMSRLIGFAILGMAIGIALNRIKEFAITCSRPEMYQQLTSRLPPNSRLLPHG